jgi:hypothetical protein
VVAEPIPVAAGVDVPAAGVAAGATAVTGGGVDGKKYW